MRAPAHLECGVGQHLLTHGLVMLAQEEQPQALQPAVPPAHFEVHPPPCRIQPLTEQLMQPRGLRKQGGAQQQQAAWRVKHDGDVLPVAGAPVPQVTCAAGRQAKMWLTLPDPSPQADRGAGTHSSGGGRLPVSQRSPCPTHVTAPPLLGPLQHPPRGPPMNLAYYEVQSLRTPTWHVIVLHICHDRMEV